MCGVAAASVMAKLVDKAFGQAKCKPNAQELAQLMIEAEAGEHVTDELIKGCGAKQPKIAGASAECLRMAVQSFGLRALGPQSKAVVKLSVTLFDRCPSFPLSPAHVSLWNVRLALTLVRYQHCPARALRSIAAGGGAPQIHGIGAASEL